MRGLNFRRCSMFKSKPKSKKRRDFYEILNECKSGSKITFSMATIFLGAGINQLIKSGPVLEKIFLGFLFLGLSYVLFLLYFSLQKQVRKREKNITIEED